VAFRGAQGAANGPRSGRTRSRGREHAQGSRAGFSLIELLVVVTILGMMVGVTTISWRSIAPRTHLDTDLRTLAARIAGTRSDAISRNAEFQIVYDLDNGAYWVRPPFNAEGEYEPDEADRAILYRTELHDGVEFAEITIDGEKYVPGDGLVKVRFDPLGASNDHRLVLFHRTFERWHTIEVLALTGRLEFHDYHFERQEATDSDFD
jgi:prepilin-type N-terminal cleavage/methylation domain-containing protein